MDTNSKDDVIAQTSNNQENDILLNSLSFNGLEVNPVISSSLHLILLSKKISESNDCTEKEIEEFKKDFINEILSISAKLSTLSIYDEQDITRFRYCLCVFIDEMVMKNQSFMSSTYSLNSLSIRFFKEPIFVWMDMPDQQCNVILTYIIGAILPIVSLLMTSMVTNYLNKESVPDQPVSPLDETINDIYEEDTNGSKFINI